jgi:hypothetical protein
VERNDLWTPVIIMFSVLAMAFTSSENKLYKNENWGFLVRLPKGLRYETSRAPNPNHGFQVPISRTSFVWVNAESSDDQSLSAATKTELGLWLGMGCSQLGRSSTSLGKRPANWLMLKCPAGLGQNTFKRVSVVVALESPLGVNNTAYAVGVAYMPGGDEARVATATFDVVRRGFQFIRSQ